MWCLRLQHVQECARAVLDFDSKPTASLAGSRARAPSPLGKDKKPQAQQVRESKQTFSRATSSSR